MKRFILTGITISMLTISAAFAADPVQLDQEIPVPPAVSVEGIGIWGAIAYSSVDSKRGIFWGGDTRAEAEEHALRYCQNASGTDCKLVETFRNHRHWNDDDGLFPYNQCAALAVDKQSDKWGASSATSIQEANASAMEKCASGSCEVVEQGCT
ncbi:DUF4189 domain-containing protein [Brucella intermedia]|uniref:DUF4189 domain-containing protein n=1 Tax=Brucella intermedia TaxID=94625 RepID=UPI0023600E5A|nr:DUF4189 domain-containing protein [Brucella intermedia]